LSVRANTNEADITKPAFSGTTIFVRAPPSNTSHVFSKLLQNVGTLQSPTRHIARRSESVHPAVAK
jgi:hypothetical protein